MLLGGECGTSRNHRCLQQCKGKKNLKCSFFSKYSAVGVETRGEWVKYEVLIKCKGQCKTLTSNRKGH